MANQVQSVAPIGLASDISPLTPVFDISPDENGIVIDSDLSEYSPPNTEEEIRMARFGVIPASRLSPNARRVLLREAYASQDAAEQLWGGAADVDSLDQHLADNAADALDVRMVSPDGQVVEMDIGEPGLLEDTWGLGDDDIAIRALQVIGVPMAHQAQVDLDGNGGLLVTVPGSGVWQVDVDSQACSTHQAWWR